MAEYYGRLYKIAWGATFANTLNGGYPLDNVRVGPQPREGSEWNEAPSGERDAWYLGTNYYLEGDVGWVPGVDTTDPVATGWDGATGWQEFLIWAWKLNTFRFYPDRVGASATYFPCQIVAPMSFEDVTTEDDGTMSLRIRIVRTDGGRFDNYVFQP